MLLVYRVLRFFFGFCIGLFYRTIDVRGTENIPNEGAVIFAGNHPNGLVDPILVGLACDRQVTMISKETLFHMPVLGWMLRAVHAVPVRRRQDCDGTVQDNSGALEAMTEVLLRGDCMAIFPEGISHDQPEIHHLKTGFARAAYSALDKSDGKTIVSIVPCGLNYMQKNKSQSEVFIQFGHPIVIDGSKLQQYRQSEEMARECIRELTNTLREHLQQLTLNAKSNDDIRLIHLAREIYAEPETKLTSSDFIVAAQKFLKGYLAFKDQDPEVAGLYAELANYQTHLDLLRLSDHQLHENRLISQSSLRRAALFNLLYALIILPLSIPGDLLINTPVGMISRRLAARVAGSNLDQVAHYKIAVSIVFVPLAGLLVALLLLLTFGWRAMIIGIACIAISGFVAQHIRPISLSLKLFSTLARGFLFDVRALRQQRQQLYQRIKTVVDKYDPELNRILRPQSFRQNQQQLQ